jgi:hypothetical protein
MTAPITIQLDQDEFELLTHAVRATLSDFSHDEADIIYRLRALLAKLAAAENTTAVPS